ncbi:MAG: TonB-dependent receptor plug domain-containing protein [Bacteroidia bacterium]|nr:TonB-dependent receptor plug domain-containing protein [Bacteroidia bacterium]MDW8235121.1 TonB-dependent receptor plug domain-containing protein [Bacteroidia bacterium]
MQPCELAGYVPFPYADIELLPPKLREKADSLGYFHIHSLCPGTYTLRVWHGATMIAETTLSLPIEAPLHIEGKMRLNATIIEDERKRYIEAAPLEQMKPPEVGLVGQIQGLPGVAVTYAGPLIQKPILEGLQGTRIAYWQGGQPLASQQWGAEHAPEIDPFSSEVIEVRMGPHAVRYGTEALGGVIALPLPTTFPKNRLEGTFLSTGIANGKGGIIGGRLHGTLRGWGYRLQGSALKLGTLRTPDYFLTGTTTQQGHFSFALQKVFSAWHIQSFYASYIADLGIFQGMQVGNLTDLERAMRSPRPLVPSRFHYELLPPFQHALHELFSIRIGYVPSARHAFYFTYGRQYNLREEQDAVGIYTAGTGIALNLQLTTHFLHLNYQSTTGLEGCVFLQRQRNLRQYAYFIPSFRREMGGAWLLYRRKTWEVGTRVEAVHYAFLQVVPRTGGTPLPEVRRLFLPLAVELEKKFFLSQLLEMRLKLALIRRAPNPAELYAFGYHQGKGAFEIGGNHLRSEPVVCLRSTFITSRAEASLGLWGSSAWIWEALGEPVLSLRGASLSILYMQSPAGWLTFSGKWLLGRRGPWEAEIISQATLGAVQYQRATWIPMPLLPPPSLRGRGKFSQKGFRLEAQIGYTFSRRPYDLRAEYSRPPRGFLLLGGETAYERGRWQIGLTGDNMLNVRYRAYPDLMRFYADQVGRQVRLSLRWHFVSGRRDQE